MPSVFSARSTSAVSARLAQVEAAASDVLAAERAALAHIEHCKREALRLVADSGACTELIHKRTEARIERLRERMRAAAQLRQQRIRSEMAALASDIGTDASMLTVLDAALALIVDELAGNAATR